MTLTRSITVNRPLDHARHRWQRIEGETSSDHVRVTFASARGGKETEIRVELLKLDAPNSVVSKLLHKALGAGVAGDVDLALRQFKQLLEIGEITRSDASMHEGSHAARPAAPGEAIIENPFVSVSGVVHP